MTTAVRGLLLVNAQGERYFIEAGIKANKLDPTVDFASTSTDDDVTALNRSEQDEQVISDFEQQRRTKFFADNPALGALAVDIKNNLGPRVFEAFNVFLERDDDGGDSEITGNGHTLSQS